MLRTAFHMLLGVLLWAVFAWYWHIVMQRPITAETRRALIIVGSVVTGITLFDIGWIFHNVRIARRTRRSTRRSDVELPAADFLGRTFVAQSEDAILRARYVEVHVIQIEDTTRRGGGHKLFRVNDVIPRD